MKWWEVAVVIISALQLLIYMVAGGVLVGLAIHAWIGRRRHKRLVREWTEMRKRRPLQTSVPHEPHMRVADNGHAYLEKEE